MVQNCNLVVQKTYICTTLIMAMIMKGLTLFRRTTKSDGIIKLRFRLRDGRGVDLYHKSEIKADLKDLSKFNDDGELRPKVSIYNHELKEQINREMSAIAVSYTHLTLPTIA